MCYVSLTKPDVSFLVVITTLAGYALGAVGPLDWLRMAQTVMGTTLVAAGTSALNHYLERDTDARMRRTAARPLPSGALAPGGSAVVRRRPWPSPARSSFSSTTNALAAALAALTSVLYLGVYTPLKTRTTAATLIGAFPGALPPADRLGRRARIARPRRLGAVRHFVSLAGAAFPCHLLDLSRGLRPRRNSHASRWSIPTAGSPSARLFSAPRRSFP